MIPQKQIDQKVEKQNLKTFEINNQTTKHSLNIDPLPFDAQK